jgi:alpha-1,3-rhamnosyltransferase
MPRVSIVVPAYNRGAYLHTTIESVIGQTFRDWELVIHDDGSTDDTLAVARSYADNARIRVSTTLHGGVAVARNAGYAATDGQAPYVIFLDSDDVWEPDALKTMVECLESHPEWVGVHCTARCIDARGEFVPGDTLTEHLRHRKGFRDGRLLELPADQPTHFGAFVYDTWVATPGTLLIRRHVLEQVGTFDPAVAPADDADLVTRLSRHGDVGFIDSPLLRWRRHADTLTNTSNEWGRVALAVRRRTLTDPSNTPEQLRAMRSAYVSAVLEMLGEAHHDARRALHQVVKATNLLQAYARANIAWWRCGRPGHPVGAPRRTRRRHRRSVRQISPTWRYQTHAGGRALVSHRTRRGTL